MLLDLGFSEDAHHLQLPHASDTDLLEQFATVFFHLLVICSFYEGFVILTSSGERLDPSHANTLLGEVAGQSSIMNLLHVLLDFSFGVLQQVCLTLKQETDTMEALQNNPNRFNYFLHTFLSLSTFLHISVVFMLLFLE